MKIVAYELLKVPPRWLFLKLITDDGCVGWGEPVLEGYADVVEAAVKNLLEAHIIGKDARNIEDIWTVMYRGGFYRGGGILMSAISGIDQALWDIKGKYFGVPIYELLGGQCRNLMRVYSWVGGDRPSDVASAAKIRKDAGFSAIKMNATDELQFIDTHEKIDKVLERVSAIRDACGRDFGIALDFHGRIHKPMAKVMAKKLEEFDPMFIEEPVLCENAESFRDVAMSCNIPIATGERLFSRWDFKELLQAGYVDIIQPDLSHAGGISECRKIATMAEAYDVALAPHCPLGPIALSSCLQIDACCYNATIQEQSLDIHYNKDADVGDYILNKEFLTFENGYATISNAPGLGVDMNEDHIKKMAEIGHNWKNPIWRHKDGSFAEW